MSSLTSATSTAAIDQLKARLSQIPQIVQGTSEWHRERRILITATDIGSIMGVSPYKTPAQLYQQKHKVSQGSPTPTGNAATRWGQEHEPTAKVDLVKRGGPHTRREIIELGLGVHPQQQYLGASPDGLLVVWDTTTSAGGFSLWLVEIKCPYQGGLSDQIPFNYWLQMQTQLYVWSALLNSIGYQLKGCLYCENIFSKTESHKLMSYWEQFVMPNTNYFTNVVLPIIHPFAQVLLGQVLGSSSNSNKRSHSAIEAPSTKKRKLTDPTPDLYSKYLQQSIVITQKDYRNFVNRDTLLDWLDQYGSTLIQTTAPALRLDPPAKYDIKSLVGHQLKRLIAKINQHCCDQGDTIDIIKSTLQPSMIDDPENDLTISENTVKLPSRSYKGFRYEDLQLTVQSMQRGVPVIMNGVLYNPQMGTVGCYDLLIKFSHLRTAFPMAHKKMLEQDPSDFGSKEDLYTFIQIKYCKLKLCAENYYVLGYGSQKAYKFEQVHLMQVLDYFQPRKLKTSFIIGRKSTYTSRGTTYENDNVLNSIGIVSLEGRDDAIVDDLAVAREWLEQVHTQGHTWALSPPSNPMLMPNMKNTQDHPWSTYKKELSKANYELTALWYVGPAERDKLLAQGVVNWRQLDPVKHLSLNANYKQIIKTIMTCNSRNVVKGLDTLQKQLHKIQQPIEFYLDFEFTNDHYDDFSAFPISQSHRYIYMVGCVCVNHNTKTVHYNNYLLKRLDREQELIMLRTWLKDINALSHPHPQAQSQPSSSPIAIYHWGAAEKQQLHKYLLSQGLLCEGDASLHQVINRFKMIDLCELFKNANVGIPGCFGYGLKEVAKQFHANNWVSTIWPEQLTGEDAMVVAMLAEDACRQGSIKTLSEFHTMSQFINYNYVDCKVIQEIVKYVRENHGLDS